MSSSGGRIGNRWKLIAGGLLAAAAAFLILRFDLARPETLRQALDWIHDQGAWGPAIFIVAYVLACVLFIPGSILTLGAGAVFGLIGTGYVLIGAGIGAISAFLIGRYLARGWVAQRVDGNATFQAIDGAVATEGLKIVLLVRLSPLFPFNLINYVFGLTRVGFRDYLLGTVVGIVPGTLMYVYIGSLANNLAQVGSGERAKTPMEWVFFGFGLLATIAVTVIVTRKAKRALNKKVDVGSASSAIGDSDS